MCLVTKEIESLYRNTVQVRGKEFPKFQQDTKSTSVQNIDNQSFPNADWSKSQNFFSNALDQFGKWTISAHRLGNGQKIFSKK